MHCVSEWESCKFRVKSIYVGSGVFNMRFFRFQNSCTLWILQESSDAGTDDTQHFHKQSKTHHGQVSRERQVSRGAEGDPVGTFNCKCFSLMPTPP